MNRFAFVVVAAMLTLPADAQGQSDPRWAPFLGCWELIDENVRDAADSAAIARPRAAAPAAPDETTPRVCAAPGADGAVTFTTTIAGETALTQTVIANGLERPVDDPECRGTQRAEWSEDGSRVFSAAQLTCANDTTPRRVSGLSLLGRNGDWIDIQAVEIGGREDVRVRRYRRATPAATTIPAIVATRLTVEDIKEASRKVSPRALEAALVETRTSFDLDGRALVDLDDAGVPGSVVDVMIALSYPDRFVVERARDNRQASTIFLGDPFGIDYGFYSPLYDSLYYPYYYSPFAYSYYGRFDPRFFGGGVVFLPVTPGDDGDAQEPPASGAARAVDGSGYTRVRPRQPEAASTTSEGGRRVPGGRGTAASTGGSSSDSSGGSSSGSSGSGGGAVSSGGFSSGGGSDTGRTAVPR